jgi:hypothetical protein
LGSLTNDREYAATNIKASKGIGKVIWNGEGSLDNHFNGGWRERGNDWVFQSVLTRREATSAFSLSSGIVKKQEF